MPLHLRYMRLSDVQDVVAIDQQAFSAPWPAHSYTYEISESKYSYMVVLADTPHIAQETGANRIRRLIRGFTNGATRHDTILGYGGLWNIMDEAHVSTIATHPDRRGKGYGEVVLAAMVQKSILLGAAYIVLEVRVSNAVAQNLYKKYDFEMFDIKRKYYRDDNEDAYDMRLDLSDHAIRARSSERFKAVCARYHLTDDYTAASPPQGKA